MYCTKDCACRLCRELRDYKLSSSGKPSKAAARELQQQAKQQQQQQQLTPQAKSKSGGGKNTPPSSLLGRMLNENFILRRRGISLKNFQPQSLRNSEMCQSQLQSPRDMPRPAQTPSPTPIDELPDWAATQQRKRTENGNSNGNGSGNGTGSGNGNGNGNLGNREVKPNHKVVIYFGDSMNRGQQAQPQPQSLPLPQPAADAGNLHSQMLQEMCHKLHGAKTEPSGEAKVAALTEMQATGTGPGSAVGGDDELPPYIESVQNGVINIKIEGNYRRASALVETVAKPTLAVVGQMKSDAVDHHDDDDDDDDDDDEGDGDGNGVADAGGDDSDPGHDAETASQTDSCDWSYVQEWRRAARR